MMWWYGNGMGGWGYLLMMLGPLLFWTLVIVGGVVLLRHLRGTPWGTGPPAPESLLAGRFARGEIDEEEYRRRLAVLRTAADPPIGR
jgi:putative membrane protein